MTGAVQRTGSSHAVRPEEARRHFQEALENDGHPVRATAPYRAAVAAVGEAFAIPVVHTGDVLRARTALGILDRSAFHDNVHPTLRGYFYMGTAGTEAVGRSRILEPRFGASCELPPARFADAVAEMQIDRLDVATALRRMANGLRWLGRLRFDGTRRNQQADEFLQLAARLDAGEIAPGDCGTETLW